MVSTPCFNGPSRNTLCGAMTAIIAIAIFSSPALGQPQEPRPYRLPAAERLTGILWGSECTSPDGFALRFGGCDQASNDGAANTAIKSNGVWESFVVELRKANSMQVTRDEVWTLRNRVKDLDATVSRNFFQGHGGPEQARALRAELGKFAEALRSQSARTDEASPAQTTPYANQQHRLARGAVEEAGKGLAAADAASGDGPSAETIKALHAAQVALERAVELLDAQPAPRTLSPIAYDVEHKLFVIFGGDHLDYLTNDTWIFNPVKRQWQQRHPHSAPPPRANHKLAACGDGKIKLSGGYTYFNDIWYMGGPYVDLADGDWTYDIATDAWTSDAGKEGTADMMRVYRCGAFHPDFFLRGEKPDAATNEAKLKALPVNTWVAMEPPAKPPLNRDWGSACIAPDYGVLLRWSGGHCAHGGSDVLIYHFATNRWELPFPVEFPLGQCYSNTSYPSGFNLNRRPWVSGHTYKCFGYDPVAQLMVFTGQNPWSYLFDPGVADWIGRTEKPPQMCYNSSFYTLTLCTAGKELYCWGGQYDRCVAMHKWQPEKKAWQEVKITGGKLPGPECDHCGLSYDAQRRRLILFPRSYKGTLYALDCRTSVLEKLRPEGDDAAARSIGFWRELAYVPEADMFVLVGASAAPVGGGKGAVRPTLAYDCAHNRFERFLIGGPHPAGKDGRNVSCGAAYDAQRQLIWATDARGEIYVLRFDARTANKAR